MVTVKDVLQKPSNMTLTILKRNTMVMDGKDAYDMRCYFNGRGDLSSQVPIKKMKEMSIEIV
jgi:hypothetical protein